MPMEAEGPLTTFSYHNGASLLDSKMMPEYMEKQILSCKAAVGKRLNTSDHSSVEMVLQTGTLKKAINPVPSKGINRVM